MARGSLARTLRHPVVVSLLAIASGVLPVFLTGALSVQLRAELHFSSAALGALVATFFLAAAAGSLAAGHVSERFGPGIVMRLATASSGLLLVAIALLANSAIDLGVLLGLAGVSNGLLQPSVNAFLVRSVRPGRQGLAFGLRQSAIPLSTLLGGLAVPGLALTIGWRWAYVAAAGIAALSVALLPSPRALAFQRKAQRGRARRPSGPIRVWPLVILATGAGLGAGAANALGAFLVPAAVAAHLSQGAAGWLAAGGSAFGFSTRIAVGAQADRRSGGHLRVVSAMLVLGALGYLLLASGRILFLLLGAALAFAAGWGWNGLLNFAVVRSHPDAPARATAITQAGVFVGSVVVPLLFGLVVDNASYAVAWIGAALMGICAAGIIAAGRRLLLDTASQATQRPGLEAGQTVALAAPAQSDRS
jgi:MFS family permease